MRHFGNVSANFWGTIELGGLGLRRVTVTSRPAYWSSWADCLGMVQQRHPAVSRRIVHALNAYHPAVHSAGVRASGAHLAAAGFVAPSWGKLADGIRPEHLVLEVDREQGVLRHGWQRTATVPIHGRQIEDSVRQRLSLSEQALFRPQKEPLSSVPFT